MEEARKVAAKVQEAVQSEKDMDKSDPYFEKARYAAIAAVAQAAGGPVTREELETSSIYFKMIALELTPENLELWLHGKKSTIEGPIFAPSYDT